uniref:Integrase, catalytic region, zinc finger, CCHC-type, peptidase aspartic, catalytic n=1 Tax=Tanacetum cinerariifolium TaxID=118510 RepID=A0A6L2MTI0_TANCI|nr:hypothetical protein [Tanacetum cinerariifolium]
MGGARGRAYAIDSGIWNTRLFDLALKAIRSSSLHGLSPLPRRFDLPLYASYDIDAFDSDCDEAPTAQAAFMANLSSYDSYVLSKELLVYVSDACPSSRNNNEKLVDVTPMNKNSGSKNMSTSKHNRISRPSSSNRNNKKVKANPRNVKSSLKKMNRVSVINEKVKHGVYSACNECLFNASHDMCVVDYLNDVNARARNKSVKSVKNKEWKPTGKVFINLGHK